MRSNLCSFDGCGMPRLPTNPRCEEHYREYKRNAKAKERQSLAEKVIVKAQQILAKGAETAALCVAQRDAAFLQADITARAFGYVKSNTLWELLNPVNWLAFFMGRKRENLPPSYSPPSSPFSQPSSPSTFLELGLSDSDLPTSANEHQPEELSVPVSSVEDLYSDKSGIMSLLIMGQPRDG